MAEPHFWMKTLQRKLNKKSNCRGLAVIVCNCKASNQRLQELPRKTTYEAGEKVKETFKDLNFATVYCQEEEDPNELRVLIQQAANLKYHELGLQDPIIVVYLIGHGILKFVKGQAKQAFCTASGELLIDDDILVQFQSNEREDMPGVEITKIPKLFFFDCCWGDYSDEGHLVAQGGADERAQESVKQLTEYTIKPRTGNMLIAHAVTPQFKTYSFPEIPDPKGVLQGTVKPEGPLWSWFLLKELKRNQSIYDALHRTSHKLVSQYEAWWKNDDVWKMLIGHRALVTIQQPVFLSTLNQETIINLAEQAGIPGSPPATGPTAGAGERPQPRKSSQHSGQGASRSLAMPGSLVASIRSGKAEITSADFAIFNDYPPELNDLCDKAADVADLWDQIGSNLKLTPGRLRIIQDSHSGSPNRDIRRLTDVFTTWRDGMTRLPYSWQTFADALLHCHMTGGSTKGPVCNMFEELCKKYNTD